MADMVSEQAEDQGQFSFAVLSDRTGMARPGVFESAVEATNLLMPELAVQVRRLRGGDRPQRDAQPLTGQVLAQIRERLAFLPQQVPSLYPDVGELSSAAAVGWSWWWQDL